MLALVFFCAVLGLEGVIVDIEVDTRPGLPKIIFVEMPDAAVPESRDGVQSAIKNSGLSFPRKSITVNLTPASLRKARLVFDLPIARGILAASVSAGTCGLARVIGTAHLAKGLHYRARLEVMV